MSNPLIRRLQHGVHLTENDQAILASLAAEAFEVPARHELARDGEPCPFVHLFLSGLACRYKILADGALQIFTLIVPGDFCHPQTSLLDRSDHSIRTFAPCTVVRLSQSKIGELLDHPRIGRALWWASLVDEAVSREWITNLGQREAILRMAHLFCELLFRLKAAGVAGDNSFSFPVTQGEIAEILGLTSVHVNRMLQQLRANKLLTFGSRRVEIPDVGRLTAYCGFDPNYLHLQRSLTNDGQAGMPQRETQLVMQ